jgi:HEAT repeats/PBS lyase HEAT-like repeat
LISALSLPAAARAPQEAPAEAARISHAAGVAVADFDEPRVVRALCAALEEPDETVRTAIVRSLASLRDPASIPYLAVAVASWTAPRLAPPRRAALEGLIHFVKRGACTALATALGATRGRPSAHGGRSGGPRYDGAGRGHGCWCGPRGTSSGPAAERRARRVAARAEALLAIFPAESVGPLTRELRPGRARGRATRALGATSSGEAVEALIAALQDEPGEVPASAARALGAVGDPIAAGPSRPRYPTPTSASARRPRKRSTASAWPRQRPRWLARTLLGCRVTGLPGPAGDCSVRRW